jgi:hypothetical protein
MSVVIPNAVVTELDHGRLTLMVPTFYQVKAGEVVDRCLKKNNGFCKVTIDVPAKPRTTGELSQNNHAWGHATQIAAGLSQGDDPRDVLYDACIATAGYPTRMNKFCRIVPQSWSMATTVQAAAVIETLHRIAAEFGITLKEGKE